MNVKQDSRKANIWWITVVFLGALLTSQCGNPPSPTPVAALTPVSTPVVSDLFCSSSELLPGEEVEIWVNVAVADQNTSVDYTWSTEGGKIVSGQGSETITYKAPDTPDIYRVSLTIECGDWDTEKSVSVIVVPPTPTPTLTPTNTPTSTNTPTPTDTAMPTPTPIPDAVVNAEALNLRTGPGTVYDVLGGLKQGDCLKILCKCPAGKWLKVICPDGQKGWVARSLLQVNVDMAGVPTAQAPPIPTPTHTPSPAVTPTPTLLPPPIPLEPENGAAFLGEPPLLRWLWDPSRAPDEVFSVRVRREGEERLCHHDKADKPEYKASLSYCTAGTHYWSVALVRDVRPWLPEEDINRWLNLSEPSEERWFYYVPSEEPWTWPTPPDEDDDDDEGLPFIP